MPTPDEYEELARLARVTADAESALMTAHEDTGGKPMDLKLAVRDARRAERDYRAQVMPGQGMVGGDAVVTNGEEA